MNSQPSRSDAIISMIDACLDEYERSAAPRVPVRAARRKRQSSLVTEPEHSVQTARTRRTKTTGQR
jgi:hypothetical protein